LEELLFHFEKISPNCELGIVKEGLDKASFFASNSNEERTIKG
jgi:hypothetical protein